MLRDGRFSLAHTLRDFSSRVSRPIALGLGKGRASLWQFAFLLMDRQEAENDRLEEITAWCGPRTHTPNLFHKGPPVKLYYLPKSVTS